MTGEGALCARSSCNSRRGGAGTAKQMETVAKDGEIHLLDPASGCGRVRGCS